MKLGWFLNDDGLRFWEDSGIFGKKILGIFVYILKNIGLNASVMFWSKLNVFQCF
jgi:hypothetical protein